MTSASPTHSTERNDKSLPRVSVIVVAFNGERFIGPLLDSLLEQDYPEDRMEIIVFDNGSADGTVQAARQRPGVIVHANPENLGYAEGNIRAMAMAANEYVAFLNQDATCHAGWLRGLVHALDSGPGVGAATSNMILPGVPEYEAGDLRADIPDLHHEDLSRAGYGVYKTARNVDRATPVILSGCSFLARRSVLEEVGGVYSPRLRMYVEDTDLSLRLWNAGLAVVATRKSIVFHHHGTPDAVVDGRKLRIAARAVMNRVFVFYSNMGRIEFGLFFPFLFLGGIAKIFEFRLPKAVAAALAVPFALFSMGCMVLALFRLGEFSERRKAIVRRRKGGMFHVLQRIIRQGSPRA